MLGKSVAHHEIVKKKSAAVVKLMASAKAPRSNKPVRRADLPHHSRCIP
jgi:hypothetical protein